MTLKHASICNFLHYKKQKSAQSPPILHPNLHPLYPCIYWHFRKMVQDGWFFS